MYCNTNLYVSTTVFITQGNMWAYILPCVIETNVLMYKLALLYVSKHFVVSSFKFIQIRLPHSSVWIHIPELFGCNCGVLCLHVIVVFCVCV